MRLERNYQADLIKRLKAMFPGCIVLKNDARLRQGIPDLVILWHHKWAFLEVKRSADEKPRPNQAYYVAKASEMCYGSFIYPENEEEVLSELQIAFRQHR